MNYKRKFSTGEEMLLDFLIKKSKLKLPLNWKNNLMVQTMNDSGMGSLRLFPDGEDNSNRILGEKAGECFFIDKDNIKVIATLNLDEKGELFELDIWKTDFNPLIQIPNTFQTIEY